MMSGTLAQPAAIRRGTINRVLVFRSCASARFNAVVGPVKNALAIEVSPDDRELRQPGEELSLGKWHMQEVIEKAVETKPTEKGESDTDGPALAGAGL